MARCQSVRSRSRRRLLRQLSSEEQLCTPPVAMGTGGGALMSAIDALQPMPNGKRTFNVGADRRAAAR